MSIYFLLQKSSIMSFLSSGFFTSGVCQFVWRLVKVVWARVVHSPIESNADSKCYINFVLCMATIRWDIVVDLEYFIVRLFRSSLNCSFNYFYFWLLNASILYALNPSNFEWKDKGDTVIILWWKREMFWQGNCTRSDTMTIRLNSLLISEIRLIEKEELYWTIE